MNTSSINLTENAVNRVKTFQQTKPENTNKYFRVAVEGGGCSGFQYSFVFDTKKDEDELIPFGDLQVLLDSQSRTYLAGSTIDFVDDFQGTGFKVTNPNAKGTCGCGVSFTV